MPAPTGQGEDSVSHDADLYDENVQTLITNCVADPGFHHADAAADLSTSCSDEGDMDEATKVVHSRPKVTTSSRPGQRVSDGRQTGRRAYHT